MTDVGIKPLRFSKGWEVLSTSFLLGAFTDFLFGGVFRIVWFALYVTFYITCASTLYTYVDRSRAQTHARNAALLFLGAALLTHVIFLGWKETRDYPMSLLKYPPVTLQSPRIAQSLVIESAGVERLLPEKNLTQNIDVKVEVIKDYGCIRSFRVKSVAGIDVMTDRDATWTLRDDIPPATDKSTHYDGLNEENARIPWCNFRWYEVL